MQHREVPRWCSSSTVSTSSTSASQDSDMSSEHTTLWVTGRPVTRRSPMCICRNAWPMDRQCKVCKRTKITRAPCTRRTGNPVPRAEKFGDLITADHRVLSEECESRNNHRYAVVVQDLATQ